MTSSPAETVPSVRSDLNRKGYTVVFFETVAVTDMDSFSVREDCGSTPIASLM